MDGQAGEGEALAEDKSLGSGSRAQGPLKALPGDPQQREPRGQGLCTGKEGPNSSKT